MNPLTRLAAAAAIVLAVGAMSIFVLSNRAGGPGGSPAPSVSIAPSCHGFAVLVAGDRAVTHGIAHQHGWLGHVHLDPVRLQIALAPTWTAQPATRDWVFGHGPRSGYRGAGRRTQLITSRVPAGGQPGTTIAGDGLRGGSRVGTTEDDWLASYYAGGAFCPTRPDLRAHHGRRPPGPARQRLLRRPGDRLHRRSRLRLLDLADRQPNRCSARSCRRSSSRQASSGPGPS